MISVRRVTLCLFLTERQFLSEKINKNDDDDDDSDDDVDKGVGDVCGKRNKIDVGSSLIAKLQKDVEADEELHKLEGKATKNQKKEKKEFRRKVIDYVLEKLPGLQTRSKRAGLVHNFLRGLGLNGAKGIYLYCKKLYHYYG